MNTELFSQKIRKLRTNKRLSQKEVSELTGISESTYSRLEQGKSIPHTDTLQQLSAFYGIPITDLVDDGVTFNISENKGGNNSGISYHYNNETAFNKLEEENAYLRTELSRAIGIVDKLIVKS